MTAKTAHDFGAFTFWPENLEWSTQMMRLIGYSWCHASEFSEIYSVARHLTPGDDQAWHDGFFGLAERTERAARASLAGGHDLTARETLMRATVYYRLCTQLGALDGEPLPGIDESRRCFRDATTLGPRTVEPVEIPYEDTTLPGYLALPADRLQRAPAVVISGGIDAFSEEMYLKIAEPLADRGYAALLLDMPGHGEARRRGVYARHDSEVAIGRAVDFLLAREEIDPARVGLIGSSLGGYYALRAAAYETRLAATVLWGAFEDLRTSKIQTGGELESRLGQIKAMFGTDNDVAAFAAAARVDAAGLAARITHPLLILHGSSDVLIPVEAAQRQYDEASVADKTLTIFPPEAPGCTHCMLDAPSVAHRAICDWLDDHIGSTSPFAAR